MDNYKHASQWIVSLASLCTTYGLYDQVVKIWRTKSVQDFTTSIVVAILINELAWLNYGLSLKEWPVITVSVLNTPAAIFAAVGYFRFRRGAKASNAKEGSAA